jgi:hypothetical protein
VRVAVGLAVNVVDELALMLTETDPLLVLYIEAEPDVVSDPETVGIFPPNTCAETRGDTDIFGLFVAILEYE